MDFIAANGIELPPMTRFAVVLSMLLCMPFLTGRLRIPEAVVYILTGVLVGPHVLGIMPRHPEAAHVFGEIGKILLMFFVGLEIDLRQFKAHRTRALAFGLLTFCLPLAVGVAVGAAFDYGWLAAFLIGALLASHTLIAYPAVHRAGQSARPSVTITAGSTVFADTLALLTLAVCLTTFRHGFDPAALGLQLLELAIFVVVVLGILGRGGKWLFAHFGKTEDTAFRLMLVVATVAAVLAELIKLEGILGAFLAGLAVNEATRDTPAKEKLEFFGNRFFIPAFFIVVGLLIDVHAFIRAVATQGPLVLAVVCGALGAKWLAARIAARAWDIRGADRLLMTSLTFPHVAATLAVALVGYEAVNASGERLLDEPILNTVLVLVVVSAIAGPVLTERALRRLKI